MIVRLEWSFEIIVSTSMTIFPILLRAWLASRKYIPRMKRQIYSTIDWISSLFQWCTFSWERRVAHMSDSNHTRKISSSCVVWSIGKWGYFWEKYSCAAVISSLRREDAWWNSECALQCSGKECMILIFKKNRGGFSCSNRIYFTSWVMSGTNNWFKYFIHYIRFMNSWHIIANDIMKILNLS